MGGGVNGYGFLSYSQSNLCAMSIECGTLVVGGGQWVGSRWYQWDIAWGKYSITSNTFMVPWQAGSNILKARNFLLRAILSWSITQPMSKWSGPVNLLTHGGGGHWSLVIGQRLEVRGQGSEGRGEKSPHPPFTKGGRGGILYC